MSLASSEPMWTLEQLYPDKMQIVQKEMFFLVDNDMLSMTKLGPHFLPQIFLHFSQHHFAIFDMALILSVTIDCKK